MRLSYVGALVGVTETQIQLVSKNGDLYIGNKEALMPTCLG